ncbi:hypothetical protein F5888DRAFT_227715 [Russula emetica]|nr:hypothetical protein F5888DRAFT_227715 [Russula emetica]
MLPPCYNSSPDSSNSFPNDVDVSSPPSNNAISHEVAPSSQDQRKQPLVDRCLSTINPDISQPEPSGALSNPVVQTTISRRSLSSQQRSFSSQHERVLPSRHSMPVTRSVAAQAESSSQSLSIATEAQNQQEQQRSQRGITPVPTQNTATFLADRVSSTANTDSPPIPGGDQLATPAVQYPPIPSDPVGNPRPRPAGFVAIPAIARARGDSINDISAENVSEARNSWIGDAKIVLIFNGVFIPTVASFIIESYKLLSPDIGRQISQKPSPPPAISIIIVNVMWLTSLVLNVTSTLFATSTLMLQTQLPQVPRTPRDHMHNRSYLFLCTLSVFLFLAGLVIFFLIIYKIVGIIVLIVLIAVGLFEVVATARRAGGVIHSATFSHSLAAVTVLFHFHDTTGYYYVSDD